MCLIVFIYFQVLVGLISIRSFTLISKCSSTTKLPKQSINRATPWLQVTAAASELHPQGLTVVIRHTLLPFDTLLPHSPSCC